MKRSGLFLKTIVVALLCALVSSCSNQVSTSTEPTPPEHTHVYNGYSYDENYHYQICTICGEETEKEYHHGGHATCLEKAHCEVCGAEYGDYDDHDFHDVPYTFDEEFHYQECNVCHEVVQTQHTFNRRVISDEYLAAPKTEACEESNKYFLSCVCGAHSTSLGQTFEVVNEHDFSEHTVLPGNVNKVKDADCLHPAVYGLVCSHCHTAFDVDHTFTYGDPEGHHLDHVLATESTCSEHGIMEHYHCQICDEYFTDSEAHHQTSLEELELPLKEHTYVEHTVSVTYLKKLKSGFTKFYTCDDLDHNNNVHEFFVKNGDEYEPIARDDLFDPYGQFEDPAYGTESNPYIIIDLEELLSFRNNVNAGADFSGKFVKLEANILLTHDSIWTGDCIGKDDNYQFSGTFDGGNHLIRGFSKEGPDSVALFSRVSNGTIKNLKMSDVFVSYTGTQRGAALVARATNCTIDNCHILSGSIGTPDSKVKNQNGGLVGFVYTGTTTIKDSSNALNIYSSGTSNGGIVGITHTDVVTLNILNCVNYGNIAGGGGNNGGIYGGSTLAKLTLNVTNCSNYGNVSGTGNGTAGIIAATGGGGTSVTVVTGCVNYGTISGAAYVGGIGGLFREGNKTTSLISNCTNRGNIVGTGVGVGGISGISRVDTTGCHCLRTVTIKGNVASTLNAVGTVVSGTGGAGSTPGYISGSSGNGATVTGDLID